MKAVAETIRVSRSQLRTRAAGRSKLRGRYRKAEDDELLPALRRLVDERPTYGYWHIKAFLNRARREAAPETVNRKRVLRVLNPYRLTPEQSKDRLHDGKVAVMAMVLGCVGDRLLERREGPHRLSH